MKGKNNKKLKLFSLLFIALFVFITQTIVYSAISSKMTVTGDAVARVEADVRITNFSIYGASDGSMSSYEEYGKDILSSTVTLPNRDSYIIYKVDVTNYGNVNMGIKNIDGLQSNLSYELIDYSLKDKLCDESNKCNLGSISTFYIKIKYKHFDSSNTMYVINLNLDFEQIFNITYEGITNNNYPTTIMLNDELNVTFTEDIPKVIPYSNGNKLTNYTYTNTTNNLIVSGVTSDVTVVYKEKVYMTVLSEGSYFKEDTYISNVKKIYFVNYIDDGNHLAEWDLSESGDSTIVGWIDNSTDYNLYIGSDWNIYSKDLDKAFYNMSGVTNIYFDNLNTSECTSMHYMFHSASSLIELDVSGFDTQNVRKVGSMFENCTSLTKLNLSNFNTSKVDSTYRMFYNCSSIIELDLSNFNTSNVNSMYGMFYNCSSITQLDLSNFVTDKVKNLSSVFGSMSKLTHLNISNFNTENLENMDKTFYNDSSLLSLDLSSFNTSKVTSMNRTFAHCDSLKKIYVSDGWDTSAVTNSERMFVDSSLLPNYDSTVTDVTKAYVGEGGYLTSKIQNVIIDGVSYQFEDGMTWGEWVTSKYNTEGFRNVGTYITSFTGCTHIINGSTIKPILNNDLINNSINYEFSINGTCHGGSDD